ncbi:hypothetical protein QZH41_014761, partial [Actinostola sp. cb2023]
SEMTTTHKKYKGEVTELHEALLHCKKEYDLLRIDYEQITKSNEQSAPLIREISYMNNSLQSYNKQLKGEIMRYKRKLSEAQTQTQKVITIMIKQIEIKGKLNCYKLAIIKIVLSVIPRKEMFLMGWKSIQKFKN